MTVNSAIASGNWETGGNWSLGHQPTVSEDVQIPSGITIYTAYTNDTCNTCTILNGGILQLGAGLTIYPQYYIIVNPGGTLQSLGTAASPAAIDQANGSIPWYLVLSTPDPMTNLDYLYLRHNEYCLGADNTNKILFNAPGTATGPWINNVTPLTRAPIIVSHNIDGRAWGRTYRRGSQAGVVNVSGHFYQSAFTFDDIKNLQALNGGLSLTTERVHLPWCSIDGEPRYNPKPGQLWCPFTLTLIEDR